MPNVTSESRPWAQQLRDQVLSLAPMIGNAAQQVNAGAINPLYGEALQTMYNMGGQQQALGGQVLNSAQGRPGGIAGIDAGLGALTSAAQGQGMGQAGSPQLQALQQQAFNMGNRNFTRNISPAIQSQAISRGAYGGNREGISQAVAAGEVDRNSREIATNLGYQDLQAALGRQFQASQILPGMVTNLLGAGTGLQGQGVGAQTSAGQAIRAEDERLPFRGLGQGVQTLAPLLGTGAQTQASQPGPSALQQGIQGAAGLGSLALGGAALYGALGPSAAAAPATGGASLAIPAAMAMAPELMKIFELL